MDPFKNARPIWLRHADTANLTLEFVSEFSLSSTENCRIYLHAHAGYALYINDTFVDSMPYPDFPGTITYDTLELQPHVNKGVNTLRLTAYRLGEDSFSVIEQPSRVLFALFQGEKEILVSSAGMKARIDTRFTQDVPRTTPQLSFGMGYDYENVPGDYLAAEEAPIEGMVRERPIPKLVIDPPIRASLLAQDQTPCIFLPASGFRPGRKDIIIDLHKELAGYLYLDMTLDHPMTVEVCWGEHLADGKVRKIIGNRTFSWVLHLPEGENRIFYPLKRMALRYLELHFEDEKYTLSYAGIRPARYPLAHLNAFSSSDIPQSRIYDISLRTLLLCMHEHYEDCPWREQALYTMDSRNQMLIGYYTFEEHAFALASLRLIAKSIRDDGYLELIHPGKAPITIPCFTAIYVLQVWEYVKYSSDIEGVRELLPVCRFITESFFSRMDEKGLTPTPREEKYWNFYEWQTGLEGYSRKDSLYDAPLQAFVYMAFTALKELERAAGGTLSSSLEEKAERLKKAFHETFYSKAKKYYLTYLTDQGLVHEGELTQALALYAGLVPEYAQADVREVLMYESGRRSSDDPFHPVTLSHSIFKYEALLKDPEKYGKAVFDKVREDYAYMLSEGATSFWETIDGESAFDNAGSLCHGWSALPAYLYLKYCVDLKNEGTKLPEEMTGINDPRTEMIEDPSRMIQDEM